MFEAFTMLAALAEVTRTARLGQLVTCAGYRNAGLLAKEAAVRRRLLRRPAHLRHRRGLVRRGVPGLRMDLSPRPASAWSSWRRRSRSRRPCGPSRRPTCTGTTPGSTAPSATPSRSSTSAHLGRRRRREGHAAHRRRTRDATNWQVGLEEFVHKSEVLQGHCDAVGRDFDDIVRTHAPDCRLFDTEADLGALARRARRRRPLGRGGPRRRTSGTTSSAPTSRSPRRSQAFVDAGCREFVLWFRDYPDTESMERFMAAVVPRLHLSR